MAAGVSSLYNYCWCLKCSNLMARERKVEWINLSICVLECIHKQGDMTPDDSQPGRAILLSVSVPAPRGGKMATLQTLSQSFQRIAVALQVVEGNLQRSRLNQAEDQAAEIPSQRRKQMTMHTAQNSVWGFLLFIFHASLWGKHYFLHFIRRCEDYMILKSKSEVRNHLLPTQWEKIIKYK